MKEFNSNVTNWLNAKFAKLTFDNNEGRYMADKSYGFDTMFFMSRFIDHFRFGDEFNKRKYVTYANKYTRFLFTLRENSAQIQNYLTEAISNLRFTGVLKEIGRGKFRILDEELLLFISSSFENAYIYLYLLTYNLYKKYGMWDLYVQYCSTSDIGKQLSIVQKIRAKMIEVNPNVKDGTTSDWAMFVTKYGLTVLNYANQQHHVARTSNISDKITTIEDAALNTRGTRAFYDVQKKNDYLYTFSFEYVQQTLRPFLAKSVNSVDSIEYNPSLAIDLADQQLKLFDELDNQEREPRKEQNEKYRQTTTGRVRTLQGEFRSGLLLHTPHKCPVCGFKFDDFLIASHIIPYAKCEDAYDAMNYQNGILLCPVCDKLFESANYMTIDATTGKIKYTAAIEDEKDFQYLHNNTISEEYIEGERRHYLKWHNKEFLRKHQTSN